MFLRLVFCSLDAHGLFKTGGKSNDDDRKKGQMPTDPGAIFTKLLRSNL